MRMGGEVEEEGLRVDVGREGKGGGGGGGGEEEREGMGVGGDEVAAHE